MERKFNDKDRWKAFRKLDLRLKQLYDYCWDMSDSIGVYEVDYDYLRLDIGQDYTYKDFMMLIKSLPDKKQLIEIAPGKFLFPDFIEVVYGVLKDGYNPHKPAFRCLKKHNLKLTASLNQAIHKLENENENERENENKGGTGGINHDGFEYEYIAGADETLVDVETWTNCILTGNDPIFLNMVRNGNVNLNGQIDRMARDHLGKCARYKWHKNLTTQQAFRHSLLNFVVENINKQPNDRTSNQTKTSGDGSVIKTGKSFGKLRSH